MIIGWWIQAMVNISSQRIILKGQLSTHGIQIFFGFIWNEEVFIWWKMPVMISHSQSAVSRREKWCFHNLLFFLIFPHLRTHELFATLSSRRFQRFIHLKKLYHHWKNVGRKIGFPTFLEAFSFQPDHYSKIFAFPKLNCFIQLWGFYQKFIRNKPYLPIFWNNFVA